MDNRTQSEYSMSFQNLGRYNYSLYLCNEHMRNLELSELFREMLVLYVDISCEMKGSVVKTIQKMKNKDKLNNDSKDEIEVIEALISEIEPLVGKYNLNKSNDAKLNMELFNKLRYFGMILRRVMKDAGLWIKVKEDASQAIFQR